MMYRDPDLVPPCAGVFALINRKRRFAYVSYTSNLQKRSHSMSHMLLSYDADPRAYWPIRDLPKHPSDEFTFVVMGKQAANPLEAVTAAQRKWLRKGYRIVNGQRAQSPTILLNGKRITLADAVRKTGKVKYLTSYRRLERGWTPEQALGLEPPAPKWHKQKQAERKAREAERAAA